MNEKTIYVRRGQVLTVESLQDSVTGEGFFLVKNEEGQAVRAREIRTAEGVVFTADESKRVFSQNGLEYDVYLSLKQHLEDGSGWGIDRHQHRDYGEVQYMRAKNIAKVVNDDHELRIGIGAQAIWKICKSLGMRTFRTAEGGAVVLEDQDLRIAGSRFDGASTPSENALSRND